MESQQTLKFNLFCLKLKHCKTQKKLESLIYPQILKELKIDPNWVPNLYSKLRPLLLPLSQTVRHLRNRKNQSPHLRRLDRPLSNPELSNPTKNSETFFLTKDKNEDDNINTNAVKNCFRRQQKNGNPTISVDNKYKLLYSEVLAAFISLKKLTNACQLSPKKVKIFLRSQSSLTKYGLFRKRYPRLKVIVNEIKKIWILGFYGETGQVKRKGTIFVSCCQLSISLLTSGAPVDQICYRNSRSFQKIIKTEQPKKFGLTRRVRKNMY